LKQTSALKAAEAAIESGDYSQCILLLESLISKDKLARKEKSEAQILLVTAWIGQGNDQKAIETCQALIKDKDSKIREKAKQLISILEAPSLPRPSSWSVKIPNIDLTTEKRQNLSFSKTKEGDDRAERLPPTGPTKNLDKGFSIVVLAILLLLTILLSGCVQLTSTFETTGPDRVKMSWDIESNSNIELSWQKEFQQSLAKNIPEAKISSKSKGTQVITMPRLTANEANKALTKFVYEASQLGGFTLKPPIMKLSEKNWVFGVNQDLQLIVDLIDLPRIPGLKLSIIIKPLPNQNNIKSKPLPSVVKKGYLIWNLKQGELNQIKIIHWQWSRIAIGILIIILITTFSLLLQNIRLKMGLGFPELPP
tara:strand:- start:96 stop:1196 length:1101 start_codon:yes stop_codon:yes gene_type:complete